MKLKNILATSLLAVSFAALSTSVLANTNTNSKKLDEGYNSSNRLEFNTFTRVYQPVQYQAKVGIGSGLYGFGANAEFNYIVNAGTLPEYRSEFYYGYGATADLFSGSTEYFTLDYDDFDYNVSGIAVHGTGLIGFKTVLTSKLDFDNYAQVGLGFKNISTSNLQHGLKSSLDESGLDISFNYYVGLIYDDTYTIGLKATGSSVATYTLQLGYQF